MYSLRPYQQEAVERVRGAFREGRRAPLLVSPTGSGKTVIFSYITEHAAQRGNPVLILVHRQELLDQTHRSLAELGVPHGLIAAGRTPSPMFPVQIAGVQTLRRRLPFTRPPKLIIVDEAHHANAGSWRQVLAHFPEALVLGTTATPERLDGKGLGRHCGGVFDCLIRGPEVQALIDAGFLCRPVYYAPPGGVDMTGAHMVAGDFNKHEAAERTDKPVITGSAVEHYRRICPGVPAVAFCASIKHAEHVAAEFQAQGFRAAVLDGSLDDAVRRDRVKALSDGRLNVLTSCDIISEGFDLPIATAAILLRPTASLALHLQQVGRVLRPAPNKPRAVILDHVGNCLRHGLAEEVRDWSLDGAKQRKRKADDGEPAIANRQCPKCYAVHAPGPRCPACGHIYEIAAREIEQREGQLQELSPDELKALAVARAKRREIGRAQSREDLEKIANARGYKPKWVDHILRSRSVRIQAFGSLVQQRSA